MCKLTNWKQEICYEHNDFDSSYKQEGCIHCIPPFKLCCFPSILRNVELRNKGIRALQRQNKDKTEWKPFENDRVCSIYFLGSAYQANSVPILNLSYEIKEKKARRTLISQPLPKKSKIKENNDVNDEDDVVPLPISTTVTESQPTVTCSTPYNWSATPLASLDHSYCMNEENMSLPSYSDLADEIKALKIENNILKDKIKASNNQLKS